MKITNTYLKIVIGFVIALAAIGLVFPIIKSDLSGGAMFGLVILELTLCVFVAFKLDAWKPLGAILLLYVLVYGILTDVPRLIVVNESIRNLYFHVPMWFGMIILLISNAVYSIKYLMKGRLSDDIKATESVNIAVLFGTLGFVTGMIWANYTWGSPFHNDPKQLGALLGMLIYFALLVLRMAIPDETVRARVSAVYSILAIMLFIVCIRVLPDQAQGGSTHPGEDGNPGFGKYDLNDQMKLIFYPAIIAWTLIGVWMASLRVRYRTVYNKYYEIED